MRRAVAFPAAAVAFPVAIAAAAACGEQDDGDAGRGDGGAGAPGATIGGGEGEAEAEGEGEGEGGGGRDGAVAPRRCLVALVSDEADNLVPLEDVTGDLEGIARDVYTDNAAALYTQDADVLALFDVVVFYNRNRLITQAERDALAAFVDAGGGLLVTGHDSLGDPDDALLAALVRSSGTGDLTGVTAFRVTAPDHPIADGPEGTVGPEQALSAASDDHDAAEADVAAGAVTVAELSGGRDKIIASEGIGAGGKAVYWNGNGAAGEGRALDFAGPPGDPLRALARNAIRWLCE